MPKIINYTLSEKELKAIEQAIKNDPDLRVRQRAQIIRLLHKGKKPAEVGELLSVSKEQVYWRHKRWREQGFAGLSDQPRSGRPQVANAAYRARLEEVLETDPQTFGYGFTVWTVSRLLAHMEKETGITFTERTMYNVLYEMDYVFRRPKHDLTRLQDADAKARAEETIDDLKKKPRKRKSNFSLWTKRP